MNCTSIESIAKGSFHKIIFIDKKKLEELIILIDKYGFKYIKTTRDEIPYLNVKTSALQMPIYNNENFIIIEGIDSMISSKESALLKIITGTDRIYIRPLFMEPHPHSIKYNCSVIIPIKVQCNDLDKNKKFFLNMTEDIWNIVEKQIFPDLLESSAQQLLPGSYWGSLRKFSFDPSFMRRVIYGI